MIVVFIPVYNEGKNINCVIESVKGVLKQIKYKIVVVNDCSTDNTDEILKRAPGIELISNKEKLGLNDFFNSIFRYVKRDKDNIEAIVVMEGDNTSDHQILLKMLDAVRDGYDVVIGSRFVKGGGITGFPFMRTILTIVINILLRFLFDRNVLDWTIFYRAYSIQILLRALDTYGENFLKSKEFVVNSELLLKLLKLGASVKEIPHCYKYYKKMSESKMKSLKNILSYLKLLWTSHL